MADTIETLIKLSKNTLDELRNKAGMYYKQRDELEGRNHVLEMQLKAEEEKVGDNPEAGFTLSAYTQHIREIQQQNNSFIRRIDKQLEEIQGEISDAYATLKQYEILQEQRERKRVDEFARRERETLDEIAMQRFQYGDETP